MSNPDILEKPDVKPSDIEENKFAHYAEKNSITEGYVLGTPVVALCGKIFVPSRDPHLFPICPECKEIMDFVQNHDL